MAKVETITNHIGRNQECTLSNCIHLCAIGRFDFSLPTDKFRKYGSACVAVYGIVSGTLFVIGVIGVALRGWSSFEFDTIQANG